MKILVLGGTKFLGRHITEVAMKRGHEVTLFNRGETNPELFPEAKKIKGDRNKDLELLLGKEWDAVIDPSGYFPKQVKNSAQLLSNQTSHYTFISSISVYNDFSMTNLDESAEVTRMDKEVEEVTGETYGPLKALCEEEVRKVYPSNSLIIRPGLIVGPHDPTDRFTYWPTRIADGGEVLAPGNLDTQIQFIDVRDLSSWIIKMIEKNRIGTYNATGPTEHLTMGAFLEGCVEVANEMGKQARLTWVSEEFLLNKKVGFWIEVPFWIPEVEYKSGMLAVNLDKAIHDGLECRPIKETIEDTIQWNLSRDSNHKSLAGLDREKEKKLLKEWE